MKAHVYHPAMKELLTAEPRNQLIYDENWRDYRTATGMNPSTLVAAFRRRGAVSMLHLKHAWENPRVDKAAWVFGRAVHTLAFEPYEFQHRYSAWDGARRGREYNEAVADAMLTGKQLLTADERDRAMGAAAALAGNTLAHPYTKSGKAEVTLFCGEGRIQCRGRVDWINGDPPCLVDLKTTRDAAAGSFGNDFLAYHYDVKMGLYQRWLEKLTGSRYPVVLLCVESEPPHDATVVPVPDAVLDKGVEKSLGVLRRLPRCIETDTWPGVANGEEYPLMLPAWYEMEELEAWSDE